MDYKKTGEFLKSLRKANGLTQEDVANHLLVSPKTISRWECGDGLPDINIISDVAALYNVTVDEILKGEKSNKEENLKEETIILKNKNRDKALINSILKPFNIYFIVSISISLFFLVLGFIVSFINYVVGIILLLCGILVSIILLLIGRKVTKDKITDNEDIINEDIKQNTKNKLFFRTLNFIDILCLSIATLAFLFFLGFYSSVFNSASKGIFLDLFMTLTAFILLYLVLRLPLINAKKAEIKKGSIIAVIIICIIFTPFLFWLTFSAYNLSNRNLYFYYFEQYSSLGIEQNEKFINMPFYLIFAGVIGLTILFSIIKKYYLLFIPLVTSILANIPAAFRLKYAFESTGKIFYDISPSITGVMLVIIGSIFIIILSKKNKLKTKEEIKTIV